MKKIVFFTVFAVFGLTINAQEKITKSDVNKATDAVVKETNKAANAVSKEANKLYNQAKTGGFKVGANIGLIGGKSDVSSFNLGVDIAWLWEVADNIEVGGLAGYTHFFGKSIKIEGTSIDFDDISFMPLTATGRYYFSDYKMYAGLDLGYAIHIAGDADGGFYFRPKFGYNLGKMNLVGSYQQISGDGGYFSSINVGVEFAF